MEIINVKQMDLDKVSRLEVIDAKGRSYSNWNCSRVLLSLQDDKRILKIFVDERDKRKEQKVLAYKTPKMKI